MSLQLLRARVLLLFALSAWVVAVAGAPALADPNDPPESGMLFAAGMYTGATDLFIFWEPPDDWHNTTRCADTVIGLSYGIINWDDQTNTAGGSRYDPNVAAVALRNQRWDPFDPNFPDDGYERFGHWRAGHGDDPCYRTRGVARYDNDSFLLLSTQRGRTVNANGARPPSLMQLEYRADEATDEQYVINYMDQVNYQLRAACAPFGWDGQYYQWGPEPDPNLSYTVGDWTWTGGGVTGRLQIADSTKISKLWRWNDDPSEPLRAYQTFDIDENFKYVDDGYGGTTGTGTFYQSTVYRTERDPGYWADSSAIDLAVFYGETENIIYTTQFEGRIYKMVGAKNLGYRRKAGQPAAGGAIAGHNWAEPIVAPSGAVYVTDFDSGLPTIGDDPSGPYGPGVSVTEQFNEDPNNPGSGDPVVPDRHYMGLAVDAGGRVFAVSERIVDTGSGEPIEALFAGSTGVVANADPNAPDPNLPGYTLTDTQAAPFGQDNVGDKIILISGSGINDPTQIYQIVAVAGATIAQLDTDPGDSGGVADVSYRVYPAGNADPQGRTAGTWTSEAFVDVYQPDGSLDASIDLNALTMHNGVGQIGELFAYGASSEIDGFVVKGDVEVDPGIVYGVPWPDLGGGAIDPPGDYVTRLWICGAGGDGSSATYDGMGIIVVDVEFGVDNTVVAARFKGGIDDNETPVGTFHQGDYKDIGFMPFDMWQNASDMEFDGYGGMVYVGGRGQNDNRYLGFKPGKVALAVAHMEQEAREYGDGLVNASGFPLYMNLYGYGTDFGLTFENVPLVNAGAQRRRQLVASDPPADGTLCKTQNNVILLTFDAPIVLPDGGAPALSIFGGGWEEGDAFTYSIEPGGVTLKAVEEGPMLTDRTWYQITPAAGFAVPPFALDLCTLFGDANNSGRVTTADYSEVKSHMTEHTDGRADLNGSGRVTTADYSVVKSHIGNRRPAKP